MATSWVVNASPLILLGQVERIGLLTEAADTILMPAAVASEVGAKPDGAATLRTIRSSQAFRLIEDQSVPSPLLAWDLGRGETQVIATAMTMGPDAHRN